MDDAGALRAGVRALRRTPLPTKPTTRSGALGAPPAGNACAADAASVRQAGSLSTSPSPALQNFVRLAGQVTLDLALDRVGELSAAAREIQRDLAIRLTLARFDDTAIDALPD